MRRYLALPLLCVIGLMLAPSARATRPPAAPPLGEPVLVTGVTELAALACGDPTSCLALAQQGTNGGWAVVPIPVGVPGPAVPVPAAPAGDELTLTGLACGSPTLCEAVGSLSDSDGDSLAAVVTISDGQPGAPQIVSDPNGSEGAYDALTAVGCPSATVCEAVGEGEDAQSVEIDGGIPGPLAHDSDPDIEQLGGIVCADGGCTALGAGGDGTGIVVPVGGGTLGSTEDVPHTATLSAAACAPGSTSCELLGSDEDDRSLVVPDTAGTLGTPVPLPGELTGIACPSAALCAAVGTNEDGGGILIPFAGAAVGPRTAFPLAPAGAPVCVSATSCEAIGTTVATDDDEDPAIVPFGRVVTEVALNVASPRVTRTTVSLGLTCELACVGSVTETAGLGTSARSRSVRVGGVRFSLAAGTRGTVRVRLDPRGRRRLAALGHLPVELVVSTGFGASAQVAAIRAVTLRTHHAASKRVSSRAGPASTRHA